MPSLEAIVSPILLATTFLIASYFGLLYRQKRHNYLLTWAGAWALLALHHAVPSLPETVTTSPWWGGLCRWLHGASAILFFTSAQIYSQTAPWVRSAAAAGAVFGVWVAMELLGIFPVVPEWGTALVLFGVAQLFWQEGKKQESTAEKLLGAAFTLWGVVLMASIFWRASDSGLASEVQLLEVIPQLFVAVLMVMGMYEEERRRVEHNMLVLSSLNLATSSFVKGEMQKILLQALDRVRGVVRMPCGALFLSHGYPQGPKSVVAAGLSEKFCQATQDGKSDEHLVKMVARLGGIAVFRDLASDSKWAKLEKKEAGFRAFRELVVAENLRTVVAVSLQAKERLFGVLLLGTAENRPFALAELRLLLALGHQIGMAVENSYLIQQTARRSEELHILNEIGRALGATLDLDALFDKIVSEMRRLVDVNNLYIAFHDPDRGEIRFELEIVDGERKPKRSRPVGNHVTEYIIRTGQPVLIREQFEQEVRRMGVEPVQKPEAFCGVPLMLYGRARGVMAAYNNEPASFDEGHLEVLRVLAGEAAIAIENARLFADEQRKSRHLGLLNNISRHAITTLNPDEMLSKIAQEMEQALTYDHIGIGLLDYATKEVVVQAEARRRSGVSARGRRVSLEEGLVGRVARSGTMGMLMRGEGSVEGTLLSESESAIALPVVYGDQVLGVLSVETREPREFSTEEQLLLRTLADLIASALHNAWAFQKAQEQAITDGLTGVKTHRYFMEALSAEWKRSTRAGHSFSLVLMDLDRFKFVNDFYGHLEGDVVLQRVGQILEENCRRSDVVARYGGDEFVVLMPETTVDQAAQIAAKLRAWIAGDSLLAEKNITGSFGIAGFPSHGSTPQELIQVADASMYLSKHQGGNAVSTPESAVVQDSTAGRKWKRDVLEAYLGVTLKRQFATGPEAFSEILKRLQQFAQSVATGKGMGEAESQATTTGPCGLPPVVAETMTSLAVAIDTKDPYTQGHSRKVAAFAALLASSIGLSEAEVEEVRLGAILHDVGKVGIADTILNKTGPLTSSEWEVMKTHTTLGAELLEVLLRLTPGGLRSVQNIIRHHHEFYDGSGYPAGLSGTAIPRGARIVAIADAFDTITSERSYQKARNREQALAEMERCAGTQFDPQLVRAFADAMRRPEVPEVVTGPDRPASLGR